MIMEAFNLAEFKGGNSNFKKDGKYPDRVTPGGYVCTVTGLKNSSEIEGYSGSPFIEFYLLTECGKQGQARFWVVKQTDKPTSKEWKKKQLKDFLMNCGVKEFTTDAESCKQALNKRVQCAFVSEEYVGKNKDTRQPEKKTAVKYLWSSQIGKKLTYDAKYNKTLSQEDVSLLNSLNQMDVEPQAQPQVVSQSHDDADLPF